MDYLEEIKSDASIGSGEGFPKSPPPWDVIMTIGMRMFKEHILKSTIVNYKNPIFLNC
jgi:hypothetical protein